MKTRSPWFFRIAGLITVAVLAASNVSCTTTYDAYGRPQASVDPGLAVAGVAAAGLIGYALASDGGGCGPYTSYSSYTSYGSGCSSGYGGYSSYGGYDDCDDYDSYSSYSSYGGYCR